MPAKYQYFVCIKKNATSSEKSSFKKTSILGLLKTGLRQAVASNAMHFYIPTSLWYTTNCRCDLIENEHLKGMVILLLGENMLCCWVRHQSEVGM